MALASGTRLGPYEIASQIGMGGMGEVYRATDTNLKRQVAIKVLPDAVATDGERLARFQREAEVLASLNHPNIAAIYGLEKSNGTAAIVMELVEGPTLADRIAKGPIPLGEALPIARQIAEALEAAHEQGVIHRDLKPANITVRSDGTVKVLDFGLAKALDPLGAMSPSVSQSPTITSPAVLTGVGVLLGTPAYMSPEQARGQALDKRTDIWAFGCLLYEMLAGRPAFARGTMTDTLAAVVERDPDWSVLPPTAPAAVRRLLKRCLDKDPKRRLRDIGDARSETDDALLIPDVAGLPSSIVVTSTLRRWRIMTFASLLAFISVSIALAVMFSGGARSGSNPTAHTVATRLTNYTGRQNWAALAPDGRSFAFVSDHAGPSDIWLRQVSGGEPLRVTNDAVEEADLAFSPDGEDSYYTRTDGGEQAIWRVGRLGGGQAQKVVSGAHSAAPSPDGRTLAYMVAESVPNNETLVVSALDGSGKRALVEHVPNFPRVRPAWSPDASRIAYTRAGLFAPSNLFVVDLRDGHEQQVTRFTRAGQNVFQPAWLPDNRHIVLTYAPYSRTQSAPDLAILDLADGSISRVTTTINDGFGDPSISDDGSRLIATAGRPLREVWKVPLTSPDADVNGRASVRMVDATQDPLWTFVARDERELLFNSPASGSRNLWMMPLDGRSGQRQITTVAGDAIGHSSLSPDRARVAFVSFAGGASDIWTQNVDGSDLRQLTNDSAADSWPVWSPDGGTIVYTSANGGSQETRLIPVDGGPSKKLVDGFFRGDWVEQLDGSGTWIVTSNGTDAIRLIDVEQAAVVWQERILGSAGALPMFSPDRRSIAVKIQEDRDHDAVTIVDVVTRQRRLAARLPFHIIFRASWIDNGTALIVNRTDQLSNIVLFDRFWDRDKP